jgi:hypothetical protein
MLSLQHLSDQLVGGEFQGWWQDADKVTGGGTAQVEMPAQAGIVNVLVGVILTASATAAGVVKDGANEIGYLKAQVNANEAEAFSFPRLLASTAGNALTVSITHATGDVSVTAVGYRVKPAS